jgi:Tfp pilus assembly protein PilF
MTHKCSGLIRAVFFCLAASLLICTSGFALDKRVSLALSHYIMGGVYDQSGQIKESIREYKEALKADCKNALLHSRLASGYIKNKEFDKAITELNLAISLDPQTVEAHALLALLYSSQNKITEASREYEIALYNASRLEPGNIDIYRSLASFYLQEKKFKEA